MANRQGAIVYLKDIAEVKDGTEDRDTYARINEKQGLRILYKTKVTSIPLELTKRLKRNLIK